MGSSTKSGTPVETRGLTRGLADLFGPLLQQGGFGGTLGALSGPLQRVGEGAIPSFLGFDPRQAGIQAAVGGQLAPIGSQLDPLFQALIPFERRAQSELGANLAGTFGNLGGRFSGNLAAANALGQADLANQFAQTRAQAALGRLGQQGQFLQGIAPSILGASQLGVGSTLDLLGNLMGFGAPGAAVIQPGFGSQLLGAAAGIGGSLLGGPFGGALGQRIFG